MAHTHPVVDSDAHFVISSTTREIMTTSTKLELMQGDHLSERITFEIPKNVEGHDMSLCDRIKIHYTNTDKKTKATKKDVYIVNDATVENETVVFSWLVSSNATKYYGSLEFVVVFECLDTDQNYTYRWSTEICNLLSVGESFNNSKSSLNSNPDALEKFKAEVLSEVSKVIPEVTKEGSLLVGENGSWAEAEASGGYGYTDNDGSIHKISSDYLPESNATTPDWNQNDENASDYIKNRPGGYTDYVLSGTHTLTKEFNASENGRYEASVVIDYSSPFSVSSNDIYDVTFNGILYKNVRPVLNGASKNYLGDYDLVKYPFCLDYGTLWSGGATKYQYFSTIGGSIEIEVKHFSAQKVKIPSSMIESPKYIAFDESSYYASVIYGKGEYIENPYLYAGCVNNERILKTAGTSLHVEGCIKAGERQPMRLLDGTELHVAANESYPDATVIGPRYIILMSSTSGSSKKFKITVDDSGALTATEVT